MCTPCCIGPKVHTTQPKRHLDRFTQYKADCPRTCEDVSFLQNCPSACHNLDIHLIDRVKSCHISVVAILSLFCRVTPSYSAYGGDDFSRYSNKIPNHIPHIHYAAALQCLTMVRYGGALRWCVTGKIRCVT